MTLDVEQSRRIPQFLNKVGNSRSLTDHSIKRQDGNRNLDC